MAQFKYVAKSRTGERQEGVLDAPDKRALMILLGRMGLVPISMSDLSANGAAPSSSDKAKAKTKTGPKPAARAVGKPAPGSSRKK